MINEAILNEARAFRARLHACPEVSGQEKRTKQAIWDFLKTHTSLELRECGPGFYAAHREEEARRPSIALRADCDALPIPGGGAAHLCGHDGHAAALAGVALLLEGAKVGRDVFLLWQPAEEIGAGAEACLGLFDQEQVDEIYGAHNLPGFPAGEIFTRPGTFACASRGVTLTLTGKPTHAAYPEHGISPATALGEILTALSDIADPKRYSAMTLCTVIGAQMGQKAFGKAAEHAELWLTLRAERDTDLERLEAQVLDLAETLAARDGLTFFSEEQDVFPAMVNDPACAERILKICGGQLLAQPMRWSEDFGHYLQRCRGAFFGVGAGVNHPDLHTESYEYPDGILEPTMEAFYKLIVAD